MVELKEYNYWGNENAPPPNFKTKKQLSELGLSPVEPVAYIYLRKKRYSLFLYDVNNYESVKPKKPLTERQKLGLEKAKKTREYRTAKSEFIKARTRPEDELEVIQWARNVLSKKENYLILDTETTGLGNAEIVQIAVINLDGEVFLNTLVKPTVSIPNEVIAIHGINNEMVKYAPTFPEIHKELIDILLGKTVIIYNSTFDQNIIQYCCRINDLSPILFSSHCLMLKYAQYYGEWNSYSKNYKWQKLPGGDHSALGDCQAALELLKEMAETKIFSEKELDAMFEQYWFNRDAIEQIRALEKEIEDEEWECPF